MTGSLEAITAAVWAVSKLTLRRTFFLVSRARDCTVTVSTPALLGAIELQLQTVFHVVRRTVSRANVIPTSRHWRETPTRADFNDTSSGSLCVEHFRARASFSALEKPLDHSRAGGERLTRCSGTLDERALWAQLTGACVCFRLRRLPYSSPTSASASAAASRPLRPRLRLPMPDV
jgi:hypothetical protein